MTGSTKHTSGPWTATDPHQWLANTPRYKSSIRYGATNLGNSIAEVYLGGPGALNCDAESVNANACLIAAAPELADFVEAHLKSTNCICRLQSILKGNRFETDVECTHCRAEKLLQKAGLL
jgi:hypothetical protein